MVGKSGDTLLSVWVTILVSYQQEQLYYIAEQNRDQDAEILRNRGKNARIEPGNRFLGVFTMIDDLYKAEILTIMPQQIGHERRPCVIHQNER